MSQDYSNSEPDEYSLELFRKASLYYLFSDDWNQL